MSHTGVYPGTFDPVTNGHMDIISRATRVVDQLIIGVAINAGKGPLFTLDERVSMVKHEISQLAEGVATRIKVQPFEGLLTDFAVSSGASLIVRGLRAVSDFEYEFQMTGMNSQLNPDLETIFLMSSDKNSFISSNFVKEVHKLGGDVSKFVSKNTIKILDYKNTTS